MVVGVQIKLAVDAMITLHTCARGKVIVFVIVHIKIATKSRYLRVLTSSQCCQDVRSGEKGMSLYF